MKDEITVTLAKKDNPQALPEPVQNNHTVVILPDAAPWGVITYKVTVDMPTGKIKRFEEIKGKE